ncbi:MAG: hypothetical protein ACI8PB_002785 [Desulforhopalus sp.]|jgi:hypothetical protein
MHNPQKPPLTSFTVISHKNELREVIISQKAIDSYANPQEYKNVLNIDTIEGAVVYKTSDPEILKLQDGTILKKVHRP